MSIGSFRHKGLKELYTRGATRDVGRQYQKTALLILDLLDNMESPADCTGVRHFHRLKGGRSDTYALAVSGNWRITFRWQNGEARDVDFEDYH